MLVHRIFMALGIVLLQFLLLRLYFLLSLLQAIFIDLLIMFIYDVLAEITGLIKNFSLLVYQFHCEVGCPLLHLFELFIRQCVEPSISFRCLS